MYCTLQDVIAEQHFSSSLPGAEDYKVGGLHHRAYSQEFFLRGRAEKLLLELCVLRVNIAFDVQMKRMLLASDHW